MAKNIEIKASLSDRDRVVQKLRELSGAEGVLIAQRDTFFNSTSGRLKLREFADGTGQLISYHRPDTLEPTQCDYSIYQTDAPETLKQTLTMTLGCCGAVVKKRLLFILGRTRVHIDEVEGLGNFLELEVVLEPSDTEADGVSEAESLMHTLKVEPDDLLRGAYVDMIMET